MTVATSDLVAGWSPARPVSRRWRLPIHSIAGWLGAALVLLALAAGVFAPWLSPHDYALQSLKDTMLPPFWLPGSDPSYPLGTDQLGRDLLTRLLWGARTSLTVGAGAVLLAGLIGMPLGMIAGYRGGTVDDVISRLTDIQLAFPPVFLAIAILVVMGSSLLNLVLVLGVVSWVQYARVARASTLSVRHNDYITASRVSGASGGRTLFRHVLPNVLPPLVAIATVNVSATILAAAALSFLGLGIQPPTADWGEMLAETRDIWTLAPWNALLPGLAIVLTVLGINLLGDELSRRR